MQYALAACLVSGLNAVAGDSAPYRFEEGEPLTYKMEVAATNEVSAVAKFYDGSEKSARNGGIRLTIDYQLMPIARNEKGEWKTRVVLNQVQRTVNRDGETKQEIYDRAALRIQETSASEMMRMPLDSLAHRQLSEDKDGISTNQPAPVPIHTAEDLFEQPILAWIASDGSVVKFEDRTEIQQIMPGIKLKECLELTIPPLPSSSLQPGTTWTREVPVDLPEAPLPGNQYPPMMMKMNYTVRPPGEIEGRQGVRISVQGHFIRDGMSIPIGQHEMNYLIWITSVTKIADQIEGEFLYDPERKVAVSAEIISTYCYTTLAGRKVDNYRGRIVSENVSRSRIINRLVPTVPAKAEAAR